MTVETNNIPEIVGWTGCKTAERRIKKGEYKDITDIIPEKEYKEIRDYLVEYLSLNSSIVTKKHNRKWVFNGYYHQGAPNGVPVIKYNNNIYAFSFSTRRWGDIIAEVLSKIDGKKYKSYDVIQEEIEEAVENNTHSETIPDDTYSYLDFAWTWERHKGENDKTNKN